MDLKASTDPASLICLGRLFHKNGAGDKCSLTLIIYDYNSNMACNIHEYRSYVILHDELKAINLFKTK